jgi:hypothetical protein
VISGESEVEMAPPDIGIRQLVDNWAKAIRARWAACLRRIDGAWLFVHDHVSVPADITRGQAVLNLTP